MMGFGWYFDLLLLQICLKMNTLNVFAPAFAPCPLLVFGHSYHQKASMVLATVSII